MRITLIDTGPLVAFLNRRDLHHRWAVDTLATLHPPLLTCEAVLSEAVYLVRRLPAGGETVLEMLARGVVRTAFRLEDEAAAVKMLMARYNDVPMDLADACLVRMTEVHSEPMLVTIDTGFRDVYRRHGRKTIPTLLPEGASKTRKSERRR